MEIKFVGIKELRQNMAKITAQARRRRERLIVLRKNEPLFELRPLSGQDALIETFRREIGEARADVRSGRLYTPKEARKMLGL